MELEEMLNRLKNPSTRLCGSGESAENLKGSDVCPLCGGDEWVSYLDENGIERARPCTCQKKAIMSRRLRFAEIPEAFRGMELKTFRSDIYRKPESRREISDACRLIKAYLDDFENQKEKGMGLYIWSKTKGGGKTRIAAGIANELLKKYPVKFAVSLTILQEIKNTWRRDAEYSESRLLEALGTAEVLIIDDFGVEAPAGWINDKFYQIINERYINRKVTIFTSNEPLTDLQYDSRITNRINERVYQIAFPEESVRTYIAEQRQNELLEMVRGGT